MRVCERVCERGREREGERERERERGREREGERESVRVCERGRESERESERVHCVGVGIRRLRCAPLPEGLRAIGRRLPFENADLPVRQRPITASCVHRFL